MKKELYLWEYRQATWLELFFDLIFAVSLGQITHLLSHTHNHHLESASFIKFLVLFIPYWWIWLSHTIFSNRYDRDEKGHRFLTLVLMFLLMLMSGVLDLKVERGYRLFISIYGATRFLITYLFFAEGRKNNDKAASQIAEYFFLGALISTSALLFPFKYAVFIFFLGIAIEMILPLFYSKKNNLKPADRDHLVERIGLLAIILLGESVISLSASLREVVWNTQTLSAAIIGFVMICMIWWIYFDSFTLLIESKRDKNGVVIAFSQFFTYVSFALIANTIRHAIFNDLNINEFKMMAFLGMAFLYIGKQTAYFINVPEYRYHNIRNTIIVFVIMISSMFLKQADHILYGMALSFAVYIAVNYQSQIKIYGKSVF
ncbi:low temperature requirement protein A [Sediminitomix flava]|uniref:Low temperature requirement protein LtrA n=1 Tax=Sediminitomix flava TaxID=379075 RepID=A0A315ZCP5_SEDFL|nr:low temperature requirement protein A [Sediminitomix flava]PWJ43355.1 low temperature requirement protein LtrA [Sediminitomix flava]